MLGDQRLRSRRELIHLARLIALRRPNSPARNATWTIEPGKIGRASMAPPERFPRGLCEHVRESVTDFPQRQCRHRAGVSLAPLVQLTC